MGKWLLGRCEELFFRKQNFFVNTYYRMKIVCVSGYFDPVHVGHLEYFKMARALGDKLVVIVNNDEQARMKKGKHFMPAKERKVILEEFRCVDEVVIAIDEDRTVIKTIESLEPKPNMFCNGGDQFNTIIPEAEVCEKHGIDLVDGLGEKIQSSSWLLTKNKKPK